MKIIKKIIQKFLSFFNYQLVNKKFITHNSLPVEANDFEKEIITKLKVYSMTGETRMFALIKAFEYIFKNNIEGDFVECGVWRGGNLILLQKLIEKYNSKNIIYGYDTFGGMTEPNTEDIDFNKNTAKKLMDAEKNIEN